VLARRENGPQRRSVLHRVERQHLDRLDHVERLAVAAEVRCSAATGHQFAGRLVQQPQVLRPAFAALRDGGVGNSLMQVKRAGGWGGVAPG